jgi:hypothetical protein
MTAAQELFEVLKNARPGPNYQAKEKPAPKLPAATLVPLFSALPPKRVDLPKLGGCIEILYDWDDR